MFPRPTLTLLALFATSAVAAPLPTDLSPELRPLLENSPVPAIAAAAVLDGRIVSRGATGIRKVGHPHAVTLNDKFHVGSCTKSMTATLAATMINAGRLHWHTTIADAFPTLPIHPQYQPVTLQQLLTNSGGTPKETPQPLWRELWTAQGKNPAQRRLLAKHLLTQPPTYPPGTRQLYSNAGFAIAGSIIETVAKQPYEALLADHLFTPLAMHGAGFRAPATNNKIDHPYGHRLDAGAVVPVDPEPTGDNPPAIAPAGGVHCTITDLANYARFHLDTNPKLISPEAMARLHAPPPNHDYAMGWIVTDRPWADGRALTHTGSNTMFYAIIWLAPNKNFAAVAACNLGGPQAFKPATRPSPCSSENISSCPRS